MAKAVSKAEFDNWYGTQSNAEAIKGSSEALLENEDPQHVANARHSLESIVNSIHPGSVDGNTRPEMLFSLANPVREVYERSAASQFGANPAGILDYVLANHAKNLTQHYTRIKAYDAKHKPLKTVGDLNLDKALPFHYVVSRLGDEIEGYSKDEKKSGKIESLLTHVESTHDVVALELKLHLTHTMKIKDKEADELVKVFMQTYVRTSDRVPYIARAAHGRAYGVLEK